MRSLLTATQRNIQVIEQVPVGDCNSPGTHWPGKATECQQSGTLG